MAKARGFRHGGGSVKCPIDATTPQELGAVRRNLRRNRTAVSPGIQRPCLWVLPDGSCTTATDHEGPAEHYEVITAAGYSPGSDYWLRPMVRKGWMRHRDAFDEFNLSMDMKNPDHRDWANAFLDMHLAREVATGKVIGPIGPATTLMWVTDIDSGATCRMTRGEVEGAGFDVAKAFRRVLTRDRDNEACTMRRDFEDHPEWNIGCPEGM
jgi:hypothetical protein